MGTDHAPLTALHAEQESGDFLYADSLMESTVSPERISPVDPIMDTSSDIFSHTADHSTPAVVSGGDTSDSTEESLGADINPIPVRNSFSQTTHWDSTALPLGISASSVVMPAQNSTPHFDEDNLNPHKNGVLSFNDIFQTEDENDFYNFLPPKISSCDTTPKPPQEPTFLAGGEQQAILEEINILNTALLFHSVG
mgnify:CR=1 FL=1